ncbi:uncharacterized protein LOC110250834 [Exaiptasia diaphana]|uniref:Uncharacterized protein n=1 Tax=Exaiptasia diaphana TaxID=2652724 RepID=A0A913Y1G2_EXADI|nr:uncharacterized protein LOC110250834 [Exaiptasia diaphana]KXJ28640.1 hypothetical protein AC249_AIPGENE19405 [Exaiptasia diaphana]
MHLRRILGVFAVLVAIPACQAMTAVKFAKKCIEEYKTILNNYNKDEGTCTRWQVFVNCLSKRRELRSQMVDAMRYFATQNAIFITKMKLCPEIDYKDIKEITDETDFAKQHKYLDKIVTDEADQCAADVFKSCRKDFVSLFASEHKICDDVSSGINCMTEEAKAIGCKADIINHLAKMMNVVGGLMVREVRRYAGVECAADTPKN